MIYNNSLIEWPGTGYSEALLGGSTMNPSETQINYSPEGERAIHNDHPYNYDYNNNC